ncbi:MAG: sulfopyruvate decarboxylase subunit alpha [Candidatus Hodarchaeales archaeon]|jgi:sulfopyruvate decarboxylase subunit alpha
MDFSDDLLRNLIQSGIKCFLSVPCRNLQSLISLLEKRKDIIYTPVTREEEAVGIAAGMFLAGKKTAILMQNSGFGNSINAICSLLNYYEIPVLFIVSHRGTKGEKIMAQVPMGDAVIPILKSIGVSTFEIAENKDLLQLPKVIAETINEARSTAVLIPNSVWV